MFAELRQRFNSLDTLVGIPLKSDFVPDLVIAQDLSLDAATIIFSALALGAVRSGETNYGRFCFGASTALAKRCVGPSSFDLCLAYFLQHQYVIHAGTLNHARTIVAQTVQACHDLALQNGTCGVRGIHFYLMVYMTDQ
jgi:hypothetical protein